MTHGSGKTNTTSREADFRLRPKPLPRRKGRGIAVDVALFGIVALAVVFGVARPFVVEVFFVPSESMAPTLRAGDRVAVAKSSYRFEEPERGDIAVFERDGGISMKRVVGLPGDEVEVRDGVLFVNGEPKEEAYVDYRLTDSSFFGPESVPSDRVFVMGDNRSNSLDSREFGPVAREDFVGEAFVRFRPPGGFRVF